MMRERNNSANSSNSPMAQLKTSEMKKIICSDFSPLPPPSPALNLPPKPSSQPSKTSTPESVTFKALTPEKDKTLTIESTGVSNPLLESNSRATAALVMQLKTATTALNQAVSTMTSLWEQQRQLILRDMKLREEELALRRLTAHATPSNENGRQNATIDV
jgi:hypothetical protein